MNHKIPLKALLVLILIQFSLALLADKPDLGNKPDKAPITLESASTFADKKEYKAALEICDTLIAKKGMSSLDALKLKIRICERAGWWPEALTQYERLLKTVTAPPARNDIRAQMARIRALELNDPAGLADLSKLSEERLDKPLLGRVRYWLAGALMKQGKTEEAKVEFAGFIAGFPDAPEIAVAKGYLAQCDMMLKEQAVRAKKHQDELTARQKAVALAAVKSAAKPLDRTAVMLQEADGLKKLGKFKEAAATYENIRCQGFGPELAPATYGLGECRYALGNVADAVEAWEAVLKLPAGPSNIILRASSLLNLGNTCLDDQGDATKAAKRFEELVRLYPDSPQAVEGRVKWALTLLYQGKPQEAEQLLLAAQAKRGKDPAGPRDELKRLLRVCRGEWAAPTSLTERASKAETDRWMRLAELQFAAYDYKRARTAYGKVAQLVPGTESGGYALMQTGRCWNQLGEPDKALAVYRKFMEKPFSDNSYADDALVRAGIIEVSYKNNPRAGIDYFRYVVENCPGADMTPLAHLRLGTILMWRGDWKEALNVHQAFIQRYPKNPCTPYIQNFRIPEIEKGLAKK